MFETKFFRAAVVILAVQTSAMGSTSISGTNQYAYGANIGWINARGDITNGMVVGEYYCEGYMYGANVGWISMGDGSPTNGYTYSNTDAADFGVNHDGVGNLRGYAWGANIGWLNFEDTGAPTIDLLTGNMSGYVWGANVGWISLSNAQAYVQADSMSTGPDTDSDGIADPWEMDHGLGSLFTLAAGSDADADGVLDADEYRAGTDPLDPADYLRIYLYSLGAGAASSTIKWYSVPTRVYRLEKSQDMANGVTWSDSGLTTFLSDGSTSSRTIGDTPPTNRFWRVKALVPLSQ